MHSAQHNLVLGIDSSTTACKAIVWDLHGKAVAEGRAPLPLSMPRPAWHEQPAKAWWDALARSVRDAVGQIEAIRLAALCIAPQRETFVPVDAAGEPLRPAIVWMDERARDMLPVIARDYGADRIHRETGKPLSGNLTLGKIAWLRKHEPEVFVQTVKYLDVTAFLVQRLTGYTHTGWGCVDPTGLFDMRHNRWHQDLLAYLGARVEQMPAAFPPGDIVGKVIPEAAAATGLPAGLPIVAGAGDGQAGGLGVNITRPGQAYLNLGTAVVSGTYSDTYITDHAFRTMYGARPGSYSLETVLLGGTYTVSWFVEQIANYELRIATGEGQVPNKHPTIEMFYDEAIADIPPGAEGLMLVPYWNSAMNPYWDAAASGIVVGWRGIHTRAHLYRAILEGIAFEQRLHTEGVEAALRYTVEGYVAMGGGTRSARWCHIIADVTGKPVYRTDTPEAAALGAGILAAAGAGLFPNITAAARAMTRVNSAPFQPDARRHDVYTRLYEDVYRHLFPALQPALDRLSRLTA